MKKYISLITFIILLQSCGKNEVQPKPVTEYSTKLDGKYKLLTINSTHAVDLNRDGISSTDLKTEITDLSDSIKFFLELKTTYYYIPYQEIDQWLPLSNEITDNNGKFLEVLYGFKNLFSRYNYDEKTGKIKIIPVGTLEILSAELLENNKLKITSQMHFYTTNGWELLTLVSIYQKI